MWNPWLPTRMGRGDDAGAVVFHAGLLFASLQTVGAWPKAEGIEKVKAPSWALGVRFAGFGWAVSKSDVAPPEQPRNNNSARGSRC